MANYTSARQYFADQFVNKNNSNGNRIADCFLYGPSLDRVIALAKDPEKANRFGFLAARSTLTRGGTRRGESCLGGIWHVGMRQGRQGEARPDRVRCDLARRG